MAGDALIAHPTCSGTMSVVVRARPPGVPERLAGGAWRRDRRPYDQAYHRAMSIIVQKYGGSSVADVGKLRSVAERVMQTVRRGHQVVVVVSAMGDTTDELLAMAKQLS